MVILCEKHCSREEVKDGIVGDQQTIIVQLYGTQNLDQGGDSGNGKGRKDVKTVTKMKLAEFGHYLLW